MNKLGTRLYEMRKQKGISQEEFAEIVNTSRQAVSKWERNESLPDLEKLILIAKYYNISIDHLLNYDIENTTLYEFQKKLEEAIINNDYNISDEEINCWYTKYPNNLELLVLLVKYYQSFGIEKRDKKSINTAINYLKKILSIKSSDGTNNDEISEIMQSLVALYTYAEQYDVARKYILDNNIPNTNIYLAECEMALTNYNDSLNILYNEYFELISSLINVSSLNIINFICLNRYNKALDKIDWGINFTKSVIKEHNLMIKYVMILLLLKILLKIILKMNVENEINELDNLINKNLIFDNTTDSFSNYDGKKFQLVLYINDYQTNIIKRLYNDCLSINQTQTLKLKKIFESKLGESLL